MRGRKNIKMQWVQKGNPTCNSISMEACLVCAASEDGPTTPVDCLPSKEKSKQNNTELECYWRLPVERKNKNMANMPSMGKVQIIFST